MTKIATRRNILKLFENKEDRKQEAAPEQQFFPFLISVNEAFGVNADGYPMNETRKVHISLGNENQARPLQIRNVYLTSQNAQPEHQLNEVAREARRQAFLAASDLLEAKIRTIAAAGANVRQEGGNIVFSLNGAEESA